MIWMMKARGRARKTGREEDKMAKQSELPAFESKLSSPSMCSHHLWSEQSDL
jgi:hypothetical protein